MAEMHAEAVHRHEAPKGFIRKYIFSLDHKVIGIQYYFLALFSVFVGLTLSILMRLHLVWPQRAAFRCSTSSRPLGAPGGVITSGVLPLAADPARHDHGFLRAHHGAAERLRQLLSAHPDRRRGHGLPAAQHAVVLDDLRGPGGSDGHLLRPRRPADCRLDGLPAAERRGRRGRAGRWLGRNALDGLHRHFLRGSHAGRASTSSPPRSTCARAACR